MKRLMGKIEDLFAVVALAEAEGIWAAGYSNKSANNSIVTTPTEDNLAAVAFAEAGDFEDAREILEEQQERKRKLRYIKEHPLLPDECQYGDNEVCFKEAS